MTVVPIPVTPKQRAANKLALWQSSAKFTAVLDALLDIRPRRTQLPDFDVLISPDGDVILIGEDAEHHYVGSADDLRKNLSGIADAADLDAAERAALFAAMEEARVIDPST